MADGANERVVDGVGGQLSIADDRCRGVQELRAARHARPPRARLPLFWARPLDHRRPRFLQAAREPTLPWPLARCPLLEVFEADPHHVCTSFVELVRDRDSAASCASASGERLSAVAAAGVENGFDAVPVGIEDACPVRAAVTVGRLARRADVAVTCGAGDAVELIDR